MHILWYITVFRWPDICDSTRRWFSESIIYFA